MAIAHYGNTQTLGTEEQRVRWNDYGSPVGRHREMHKDVRARPQKSVGVLEIDLHVEGARGSIDRDRVAHEGPGECPSRIFVESERDFLSGSDGVGINLGNRNIHAQSTDRGEVKHLFRRGILSGVDEVSDVGVSLRNYAVKRRVHILVRLEVLQAVNIRQTG